MCPEQSGGGGRAGERDDVLLPEEVQRGTCGPHDHLERSRRKDIGLGEDANQVLGQVRRRCRGLDHGGYAREEGLGQFLQRSPDREVEGVHLQQQPARG
jgi:hypothetical protein